MPQLECRELGMDCDAVITGDNVEEVKQKAFAHAGEKHPEVLANVTTPEQQAGMAALLESKIR